MARLFGHLGVVSRCADWLLITSLDETVSGNSQSDERDNDDEDVPHRCILPRDGEALDQRAWGHPDCVMITGIPSGVVCG